MLVILVPVLFGMMGFALDLGRLYLIRGELHQATQAMALAAASELIGTQASLDNARISAQLAIDDSGNANKYNFGSIAIGSSIGLLSSSSEEPAFFATAADAAGSEGGSLDADGSTARFVRINVTAEAPLLFWGMLSLGQARKTPIAAQAVAGVSAPVCLACGIEPFAVAPLNAEDTEDFGFVANTKYTLGYMCTQTAGPPSNPGALPGTSGRVQYLLLNRYDENSELDEQQQAYRAGAQGLLPSTDPALACVRVTSEEATEVVWVSAAPTPCNTNMVPQPVRSAACGLYTRFDSASHLACQTITDIDGLTAMYQPDSDIADMDDYAGTYAGNQRRLITVPIVQTLSAGEPMTVLGFRQFLVLPEQDGVSNNPSDNNGRFPVLYLGSASPVKQGSFAGCTLTSGPGKVVLHQ
jgi:Flp pilus assembly protein TadG